MIAALRSRDRGDQGMTLVEVLVTTTVLVVLLGMVMVSMNLVNGLESSVSAQYQEFDQVLPAMPPIRTLIAAEVEPAPTTGGVPSPAFQSIGNFSATWTANIGTEYGNVVGYSSSCPSTSCTAGPAQVVAGEYTAGGTPVVSTPTGVGNSSCTTADPCSFQVRMYLPQLSSTQPGTSTCPVPVNGTSGGTCSYSSTYKLLVNIQDVVNNPASVDGSDDPTEPVFTYTLSDATTGTDVILTPAMLNMTTPTISGLPASYPSSTQIIGACTDTLGLECPLDDVQNVTIHLLVNKPGSGTNGEVENTVVDYRALRNTNADCYPFMYGAHGTDPTICNPYGS